MYDGTLHICGRTRSLSLYVVLSVILLLSMLSIQTLLGAYYHGKVSGILDDRSSDESVTIKELSPETVSEYRNAIECLERAVLFDPSTALHRKALTDIYSKFGSWAEAMELLKAPLPEGTFSQAAAFDLATANIREAVKRQPTNPDHHLAYGHLARETKDSDAARREYVKAISAYPRNSTLRYAVAMEYLAAGMQADALAQAMELARIDDSYKMPESVALQSASERRTPFYLNHLSTSYLFKAFEIIWRTSERDVKAVQAAVPDNDDARGVLSLFLAMKGVDD